MKFLFAIPFNIRNFFLAVFQEVKFIEWISLKKTVNYTILVLFTMLVMGLFLALGDRFFNYLISKLLELVN